MARAFGVAIALVGLLHLIFGEEPTRLFPMWPENLPGRPFWAHAAGALLLVLGGLLAAGQRRREAAAGISLVVVLSVLTQHLPRAVPSGALGVAWLSTIKFSALAAGAALVSLAVAEPAARGIAARALRFGATATPWLMGAFMAYSGYLHLRYTESVTRLLPPWMPWHMLLARSTQRAHR